jgi:hypothetical protein
MTVYEITESRRKVFISIELKSAAWVMSHDAHVTTKIQITTCA